MYTKIVRVPILGKVELPNYFPIPKKMSKIVLREWRKSIKAEVLNDGKIEFLKFLLWHEKGKPPIQEWNDAFDHLKTKSEIMADPERRENALKLLSTEMREKAEKMFPAEEMEKQNV